LNIKEYIESGILELYALDLLQASEKAEVEKVISIYPEVQHELNSIHLAMEKYAASTAVTPPLHMKEKVKKAISNLEKEQTMHLNDLPLLSRFSDHQSWLKLVKDYIPEEVEDGRFIKFLHHTDELIQMLLVSTTEFEDEIHDDLHESFLILEGKCKCTVDGEVYYMEAGEYTEIPLHAIHKVEMVSPRVVAILQRIAV
jgi:mannose-6-phosphate isomerase-like protein (cupin superfamily)